MKLLSSWRRQQAHHVAHLGRHLHRDLKPGNLYLTKSGRVKLLDFGLAQNTNTDSQMTATGAVLGTPAYMSPEQAGGLRDELTRRSDVYALGAVGYELVAGRAPYTATNSMAILRQILEGPPPNPIRINPELPVALDTIIGHSMERFPEDRYRTAEALAADLRRFNRGMRIRAKRVGAATVIRRQAWRHRRSLAIASAISLLLLSAIIVGAKHVRKILTTPQVTNEPVLEETWETTFQHLGPLEMDKALTFPLNKKLKMVDLEATPGNLRLNSTVDLPPQGQFLALFNDPDIGRGYVLEMKADNESVNVTLSRGQSGPLGDRCLTADPDVAEVPFGGAAPAGPHSSDH